MSLRESFIPKSLTTALIRPLLKKTDLDTVILKNYRPVSYLPFISKVIEIREWMNQNRFRLNDDKTELIVFASK